MKQTEGMKSNRSYPEYLTDMQKESCKKYGRNKVYREESAEAIVLRNDTPQEGLLAHSRELYPFHYHHFRASSSSRLRFLYGLLQ